MVNYQQDNSKNNQTRNSEQRNEQLRKRAIEGEPKAQAIVSLADKLEETNLAALDRLAQLFGIATVQQIAEKSLARYEEARREGASAYTIPAPTPTPNPNADHAPTTTGSSNNNTTTDQGGTDVATKQGKPRTKGGVFFYLMKEHVTGLGINYEALHLPHVWPQRANNQGKQPTTPAPAPTTGQTGSHQAQTQAHHANGQVQGQVHGQAKAPAISPSTTPPRPPAAATTNQPPQSQGKAGQLSQQPQHGQSSQPLRQHQEPGQKNQHSTTPPAAGSVSPSASAPAAGSGQIQTPAPITAQAAANKPGRAKLTVIGPLFGTPRFKPEGQEGLLELLIKTEMSQSLPKGLPNLGEATISVWCTVKQFGKIKDTLTPTSRLIIEGEPVPALDRNNRPVIRLVALRVTTVEQEQAGRQTQQAQKES